MSRWTEWRTERRQWIQYEKDIGQRKTLLWHVKEWALNLGAFALLCLACVIGWVFVAGGLSALRDMFF